MGQDGSGTIAQQFQGHWTRPNNRSVMARRLVEEVTTRTPASGRVLLPLRSARSGAPGVQRGRLTMAALPVCRTLDLKLHASDLGRRAPARGNYRDRIVRGLGGGSGRRPHDGEPVGFEQVGCPAKAEPVGAEFAPALALRRAERGPRRGRRPPGCNLPRPLRWDRITARLLAQHVVDRGGTSRGQGREQRHGAERPELPLDYSPVRRGHGSISAGRRGGRSAWAAGAPICWARCHEALPAPCQSNPRRLRRQHRPRSPTHPQYRRHHHYRRSRRRFG